MVHLTILPETYTKYANTDMSQCTFISFIVASLNPAILVMHNVSVPLLEIELCHRDVIVKKCYRLFTFYFGVGSGQYLTAHLHYKKSVNDQILHYPVNQFINFSNSLKLKQTPAATLKKMRRCFQ